MLFVELISKFDALMGKYVAKSGNKRIGIERKVQVIFRNCGLKWHLW